MEVRKEQTVLLLTVALLGYLAYGKLSANRERTRRISATERELVENEMPNVDLALPIERNWDDLERQLFSPPRDTRPLPLLELVLPPLQAIPAILPPTEPGPAPRLFGKFLRVQPQPMEVIGLFASAEVEDVAPEDDDAVAAEMERGEALTPEEQQERVQAWKGIYDWIVSGDLKFGQITNADRYGLGSRTNDAIEFLEFIPETGLPRFGAQPPITFERGRITEFGFADTIANEIELRFLEFGDSLDLSEFEDALAFGEWCIANRHESARALPIAESIFGMADGMSSEDPAPKLGLARCYEAGFQFDKAFQLYHDLISNGFERDAIVLSSLAQLEARFRLFDQAEARFAEAERFGRSSWRLQWAYGKFLQERGRPAEAVVHLRTANKFAPTEKLHRAARLGIRLDLGAALVASGDPTDGLAWFTKSLQIAPESSIALAGQIAATMCLDVSNQRLNGSSSPMPGGDEGSTGQEGSFELLVDRGISLLVRGEFEAAEQNLRLAADLDPLRAYIPWRALSYLALATGYGEEALSFIELAYENNPVDVYTLYQRGRVLASRGDTVGASEAFVLALDRELDFPEALASLGEIAHNAGEYDSAELYLQRALSIDPKLNGVRALRGLNFLSLKDVPAAQAEFDYVLANERNHPTARNGRAWCVYLEGDAGEAITNFAELDDARRSFPEEDEHRVYAKAMIETIQDHVEKSVWTDRFNRAKIGNGWVLDESGGPLLTLADGVIELSGQFDAGKGSLLSRMYRERSANEFVSLEVDLVVDVGGRSRAGVFVSREKLNQRTGNEVQASVTVSRHPEGNLQTRILQRSGDETPYVDWPAFDWPGGEVMTIRIERSGESTDTTLRVTVNGVPVFTNERLPTLGRANSKLRFGVFAEGENGRTTKVEVRKVEVVFRDNK